MAILTVDQYLARLSGEIVLSAEGRRHGLPLAAFQKAVNDLGATLAVRYDHDVGQLVDLAGSISWSVNQVTPVEWTVGDLPADGPWVRATDDATWMAVGGDGNTFALDDCVALWLTAYRGNIGSGEAIGDPFNANIPTWYQYNTGLGLNLVGSSSNNGGTPTHVLVKWAGPTSGYGGSSFVGGRLWPWAALIERTVSGGVATVRTWEPGSNGGLEQKTPIAHTGSPTVYGAPDPRYTMPWASWDGWGSLPLAAHDLRLRGYTDDCGAFGGVVLIPGTMTTEQKESLLALFGWAFEP